ncbi:MAG: hypothetical protein GVY36_07095 [Verrucomicrobia bacterium]|jgi:hypothetical protein|nr:hypothetical protein [Verrucomicrobiota bacterium]
MKIFTESFDKVLCLATLTTCGLLNSICASVAQFEGQYIGNAFTELQGLVSQPETPTGTTIAEVDASGNITLLNGDTGTVNAVGAITWTQPNGLFLNSGSISEGVLRGNGSSVEPFVTTLTRIELVLQSSEPVQTLDLSTTSRDHNRAAVSQATVQVSSNGDWTANTLQNWITLINSSGSGNGTLTYSLSANNSAQQRSGTITVTRGGVNRNFSIIQAGASGWLSGASVIADGWLFYDWFKGFKPEASSNWIYHGRHGWLFVLGDGTQSMFLWDAAISRWLFTNETVYPWMYAYGPSQGWVFFFEGGRPGSRFFKRGDTGEVVSEQEFEFE